MGCVSYEAKSQKTIGEKNSAGTDSMGTSDARNFAQFGTFWAFAHLGDNLYVLLIWYHLNLECLGA